MVLKLIIHPYLSHNYHIVYLKPQLQSSHPNTLITLPLASVEAGGAITSVVPIYVDLIQDISPGGILPP